MSNLDKHGIPAELFPEGLHQQIDEIVVEFLSKIDSIMRLLGIKPILTGIRPELAQKAILFGEDSNPSQR